MASSAASSRAAASRTRGGDTDSSRSRTMGVSSWPWFVPMNWRMTPSPPLDATDHIVVGTSIVNVWKDDAATVAAACHRIAASYPDRFMLGLGIGHPEATREYRRPYATLVSYLDQLDDLKVPATGRMLAALGPKVLRLSAERAAGA